MAWFTVKHSISGPICTPTKWQTSLCTALAGSNLSVLAVVDRRDVSQILGAVTLEDLLELYRNGSA